MAIVVKTIMFIKAYSFKIIMLIKMVVSISIFEFLYLIPVLKILESQILTIIYLLIKNKSQYLVIFIKPLILVS